MKKLVSLLVVVAALVASTAATAAGTAESEPRHRQDGGRGRPVQDARHAVDPGGSRRRAGEAGPYTVFAPTDAAFAKVPKKTSTACSPTRRS